MYAWGLLGPGGRGFLGALGALDYLVEDLVGLEATGGPVGPGVTGLGVGWGVGSGVGALVGLGVPIAHLFCTTFFVGACVICGELTGEKPTRRVVSFSPRPSAIVGDAFLREALSFGAIWFPPGTTGLMSNPGLLFTEM